MVSRDGKGSVGCLVVLLVFALVAYFGVNIGEVYIRGYRFRDAMAQEAKLAGKNSDAVIRRRLASFADSLGLPEDAQRIVISRSAGHITLSSRYEEEVALPQGTKPVFVRRFPFSPRVEGAF